MDSAVQTPAAPAEATPATEHPFALTPAAVAQVKEVMTAQGFEAYYLTVRVVPAGCSGFGYDLNLVKDPTADDTTWEQDGVKVTTDAMSAKLLGGTVVDYVSSVHASGFKFTNPNAKSNCGCGSSFST